MRLCFLTHNLDFKNGGGRLSNDLLTQLHIARPDITIDVLTMAKSGDPREQAILCTNKIKLLFSFFKIRKMLREADIVQAMDIMPLGIIAYLFSRGLKKKIIITVIGSGSIQPLHRWFWRSLCAYIYRRVSKVTAISSYSAGEIKKIIPDLSVEIINPGINYHYFVQQQSSYIVLDEPFILSVGRLKPRKGYEFSIRAFAKIAAQYPALKYIIVGSGQGEYYHKINKLISDLNLASRIIIKQGIADAELVSLYKSAELFCLLPQNVDFDIEGFGLVFVEAAALGLPVVGTKDSGAEDAVQDGQNGFLAKANNFDSAAQALDKILGDKGLRQRFSQNSLEFAKKFDWSVIIKKYINLYELLL
ncbi:MAG: hypothetical protein C3F02_00375 [Parcubacteria group bacterium]|nr:MAG: hypothetical protein C3F02_00375 [Parcubacteria group bacterium]